MNGEHLGQVQWNSKRYFVHILPFQSNLLPLVIIPLVYTTGQFIARFLHTAITLYLRFASLFVFALSRVPYFFLNNGCSSTTQTTPKKNQKKIARSDDGRFVKFYQVIGIDKRKYYTCTRETTISYRQVHEHITCETFYIFYY